ncbi:MAG: hypothetical protein RI900_1194 [Actinomycetota bacterium]
MALRKSGTSGFRVEDVLLAAQASPSSLYHHFGNRAGLMRAAAAAIHLNLVLSEDQNALDLGRQIVTHDEFCAYIEAQLRRSAESADNRRRRTERIKLGAAALGDGVHGATDTKFQRMMTAMIAEMMDAAQQKGIINPHLDTVAYCAWFQGALLGQLLMESVQPDVERWLSVAIPAALAPLRLPQ